MESLQNVLNTMGITSQASSTYDPVQHAKLRAEWANKQQGNLEGYNCRKCLNRGYTMRANDDGTTTSIPCECTKIRKSINILARSGLEKLVKYSTFARYETPKEWQAKAKTAAQKYAKDPAGRWFLATGNSGSGKTHLCVAVCRELMLRGIETRYFLWREVVARLRALTFRDSQYQKLIDTLKTVEALYIDDFLKAGIDPKTGEPKVTPEEINIAYEILNARYNDRDLITVISSERTVGEMMDIDQALGSRIYERSKGCTINLQGEDKNWRKREVVE